MSIDATDSTVIRPGAQHLRLLRARIADPARVAALVATPSWLGSASVLKREDGTSVIAGRIDGLDVVVKCRRLVGLRDRLGALLGLSRGHRQWRGAELLERRGLATAEPILLFRGAGSTGLVESLVMERVAGPTLIEIVARRGGPDPDPELGRSCGRLVGAMLRAGLRNRDLKASNIIVRPDGVFVQIDTVGVSEQHGHAASEMLMRLVVECVGIGVLPPRRVMWAAVVAACGATGEDPRAVWREVGRRLAEHGDPSPKVNPLATSHPKAANQA